MPDRAHNTSALVPLELKLFLQWKELERSRSGSESLPGISADWCRKKVNIHEAEPRCLGSPLKRHNRKIVEEEFEANNLENI